MNGKTFERDLPQGYKVDDVLYAEKGRFARMLTALYIISLFVAVGLLYLPFLLDPSSVRLDVRVGEDRLPYYVVALVLTVVYVILHELVHGAVYKKCTGEKLTYGFAPTCAYCGVPKIFTYRKTAILAVLAPFVIFTVILVPALIACYFFNAGLYLALGIVFAMHLSDCSGDLYVAFLFAIKYKNNRTLMNNTGPKMAFFVPTDDEELDEDTARFLEEKKATETRRKR